MPAETTLHDLFLDTLKDICLAEQQVLKALPKTVRGPFQAQAAFYGGFFISGSDRPLPIQEPHHGQDHLHINKRQDRNRNDP